MYASPPCYPLTPLSLSHSRSLTITVTFTFTSLTATLTATVTNTVDAVSFLLSLSLSLSFTVRCIISTCICICFFCFSSDPSLLSGSLSPPAASHPSLDEIFRRIRPPSTFTLTSTNSSALERYIYLTQKSSPLLRALTTARMNVSPFHLSLLRHLRHHPTVVFRPADKNMGVVASLSYMVCTRVATDN